MEDSARAFYSDLLGLREVNKPAPLTVRGGCWFVGGSAHIHIGIESDFRPASKAHPALLVDDLNLARQTLEAAGVKVMADNAIPVRRFYAADPFGNRLEFIDARDRHFTIRSI